MTEGPELDPRPHVVWRFRLLACSLALVAAAFAQKPGYMISDTKLDLAIAPEGFLLRALHLWDPQGAFGQLQNQAYGYLLPMGPFFWVGELVDMPGWVVQRLWIGLVMVVAFLGVVKLSGALGLGSPVGRVIAGLAYALSPRMLTTLGPISIEAWPSALAPWVLVPLVVGASRGSPRRAAALSALAVTLIGGVNAAANAAVLPLGILWLLTRSPGARRRSLMLWWPVLTFLGTLWWIAPLLLLGRYSPPFLDFIETASVTTSPTTLFDALRGTSDWVAYIEPGWQAGNDLLTTGYLVLNSGVVLALGLVGLARPDNPHRQFLLLGAMTGLLLVTAGHVGAVQGWFAESQRAWLDGALAPFRNVHKYDPVIRLPLVLGVAHLLASARPRVLAGRQMLRDAPAGYVGLVVLSVVAVVGAAGPVWAGRLAPAGQFQAIPGYWQDATTWLAWNDDGTRALLVPGSSFGTYVWGDPRDEPIQPMARSPWAVRNAIPLAPPGNIRMLDAIESRFVEGRGSPGFAAYLRRAGVSHLVVRNDLQRSADTPDPALVHQTLRDSPGITLAATFGPEVGGGARLDDGDSDRVVVNQAWQTTYPAIEIFKVQGADEAVVSPQTPVVIGGPENLLELSDYGVLRSEPTLLAVDAPHKIDGAPLVLTDGLRRRETTFGRVHESRSPTLAPGEGVMLDAPAREYVLDEGGRWETRARLLGARSLRASSSLSDADTLGPVRPDRSPYAAFDGDPGTQWASGFVDDEQPWLELTLRTPRTLGSVVLTAGDGVGGGTQVVRVRTDTGTTRAAELLPGVPTRVALPPGKTRRVRVVGAYTNVGPRLALADVRLPRVRVTRPLVLPPVPKPWGPPDVVLLSAADGYRSGCVEIEGDHRCAPDRDRAGEEFSGLDRLVTLPRSALYDIEVLTRPRPGAQLQALIQKDQPINVSASSASVDASVGSALAAVDGDIGTTWVADVDDVRPTLRLNWLGRTTLRSIRIRLDDDAAATPPRAVTVVSPEGRQTVRLGEDGYARLDPVRTDHVELSFTGGETARSLQFDNSAVDLGVGAGEVTLGGLELLPMRVASEPVSYGCGSGPSLKVDGQRLETAVTAAPRELLLDELVAAAPCGKAAVELPAGRSRIRLRASSEFAGTALLLRRTEYPLASGAARVRLDTPSDGLLRATLPEGTEGGTLALRQNTNRGWVASAEGRTLEPVTVDGWQQGWRVPSGRSTSVRVTYQPDEWYRAGLATGAGALAALVGLCVLPERRRSRYRSRGATGARRLAAPLLLVVGALVAGLLAGWVGVGVTLAGSLVAMSVRRFLGSEAAAWLAAAPVAIAASIYWVRPLGHVDGWAGDMAAPQYLVMLALGVVLYSGLAGPRPRFFSRMKGSSTNR